MAEAEASEAVGAPVEIDRLEREVFRFRAQAIAQELEINITRTAYSTLIRDSQDYCVALLTTDFRCFVQSEASIPIFVSDMGEPVRDVVGIVGEENLDPGDVMVTNFESGQHVNNVVVVTPLFHGDTLSGYLAVRSHWADLGGIIAGGQTMKARHILQEGTRYRGLRVMRAGAIAPEVLATIRANTYQAETVIGDLMAQLAACVLGAQRWQELIVPRWDIGQVRAIVEAQFAASAAIARRAVAALPDGHYHAEHPWVLSDGENTVELLPSIDITVQGDRLLVDLSGMPPQSILPINAGVEGGARAAVNLAFRYFVGGDFPADSGFFEPVEVEIPPGTVLSAGPEAPMGFWNMFISLTIDLFIRAIGNSHPTLVPASHFASVGAVMFLGQWSDGRWWRLGEGPPGGLGAEHDADGYGPVKALFLGNMKSLPIEMVEARYPVTVDAYRLRREAGGRGQHRGGPAVERIVRLHSPATVNIYPLPTTPAPGLAGGEPGELGSVVFKAAEHEDWQTPEEFLQGRSDVPAGTIMRQRGGGGGGWGTPTEEDER